MGNEQYSFLIAVFRKFSCEAELDSGGSLAPKSAATDKAGGFTHLRRSVLLRIKFFALSFQVDTFLWDYGTVRYIQKYQFALLNERIHFSIDSFLF